MDIETRKEQLDQRVKATVHRASRQAAEIRLLAVSKTRPAETIRALAALGQQAFGENYLQEALKKISELADLELEWHFIGQLQRNKTRDVAENFDWIQSVDRAVIAERLSAQRPAKMAKLNVCIQVSMSEEEGKGGVLPGKLFELARTIDALPGLAFRGLMAIPENTRNTEKQRKSFHSMHDLFNTLRSQYNSVDTLSMGMSEDFEIAIEEGSTMIRVGSALFGPRSKVTLKTC